MNALLSLLTHKRVWIAIITALVAAAAMFGYLGLEKSMIEPFASTISTLAAVLIAAITGTDYAAAKNVGPGRDHKGRLLTDPTDK